MESNDILFDDSVAPELALDFDCQHISSGEGKLWWAGALTGLAIVYQLVKTTNPSGKNPAVNRTLNIVSDPSKAEVYGKEIEEM